MEQKRKQRKCLGLIVCALMAVVMVMGLKVRSLAEEETKTISVWVGFKDSEGFDVDKNEDSSITNQITVELQDNGPDGTDSYGLATKLGISRDSATDEDYIANNPQTYDSEMNGEFIFEDIPFATAASHAVVLPEIEGYELVYDSEESGFIGNSNIIDEQEMRDSYYVYYVENEPVVTSISVVTPPDKTVYTVGDLFDDTGMVIEANYSNGDVEDVTYEVVTYPTILEMGTTEVSFTYISADSNVFFASQPVTVNNQVIGINIDSEPDKVSYDYGEMFDPTGMIVTAIYRDGSSEALSEEDYTYSPNRPLTDDDSFIEISYTYNGETVTNQFYIDVAPMEDPLITSVEVTTMPDKVTYIEGESFDKTGMELTAFYDDGSSQIVSGGYTYSPAEALSVSDTSVTISYRYDGNTWTDEVPITVVKKSLTSIVIKTQPSTTTYIEGQSFNPAGMVVTAQYNNGTSADVSGYSYTPSGALALTDNKVRISYTEEGIVKEADVTITVTAKKLTSITVTNAITEYVVGDTFDTTGMVVTANYDNGQTSVVSGYTVSPSGSLSATDTTVNISYTEGEITKTASITITFKEKNLTGIAITTPPSKTSYYTGRSFNTAGMVVTAYYDDGSSAPVTGYTYTPSGLLSFEDAAITITYEENGIKKTTQQPITMMAALNSITLSETNTTLNKNETLTLTVSYLPSYTTDDRTITWTSGNESVATVNGEGLVTAVGRGTTVIQANCNGKTATCYITVKIPLQQISISRVNLTINAGSYFAMSSSYLPADTTDSITRKWTSADPSIASINSSGVVTAIAPGTTTIKVQIGSLVRSCTVKVKARLTNITLNQASVTKNVGDEFNLTVAYNPVNTTDNKTVTWTSSDTSIATVDSNGKVNIVGTGKVKIMAKVGSRKAVCKVTATK